MKKKNEIHNIITERIYQNKMGNCFWKRDSKITSELEKQTDDLPLYQVKGEYYCKVVSVYDGDTCTIIIYNKGGFEKHKLRMWGYDSPEMKPPKNAEDRDEIIKSAHVAKETLEYMVLDKICLFKSMGNDKYGRLLGVLISKDINVNERMVEENCGYIYTGGTKKTYKLKDDSISPPTSTR